MDEFEKFELGENVRIVGLPKDHEMYGVEGTYAGVATNDGYLAIVILNKPTDTHIAVTFPVECLKHGGPMDFVSEDIVDEAMFVQSLRSDRRTIEGDRHWMRQSLKAAFHKRMTGKSYLLFPNAAGLDVALRGPVIDLANDTDLAAPNTF